MWIDIRERLPETGQDVIVACRGYAELVNYGSIRWWFLFGDRDLWILEQSGVTHWMPQMEVPKGDVDA